MLHMPQDRKYQVCYNAAHLQQDKEYMKGLSQRCTCAVGKRIKSMSQCCTCAVGYVRLGQVSTRLLCQITRPESASLDRHWKRSFSAFFEFFDWISECVSRLFTISQKSRTSQTHSPILTKRMQAQNLDASSRYLNQLLRVRLVQVRARLVEYLKT